MKRRKGRGPGSEPGAWQTPGTMGGYGAAMSAPPQAPVWPGHPMAGGAVPKRRRKGPVLWIILAVVVVIAAGVLAAVLVSRTSDTTTGAGVTVTNESLVFGPDHPVSFTVRSSSDVAWAVSDLSGKRVASGSDRPGSNGVTITPADTLAEGWYTLTLATPAGTTTADFMVVGAAPPDDPYFGAATHHRDPAKSLPMMNTIGLDMSRADANWSAFETQPGVVKTPDEIGDWVKGAAQVDSRAIWVMAYGNKLYQNGQAPPTDADGVSAYANYINEFLSQNPEVRYIEVYNEFNRGTFNTSGCRTGGCYADLLKAVYQDVKPDHEDVTIIGGGYGGYNAGWFNDLFAAGGWKYADAWSYHPYGMSPSKTVATIDSLNGLQKRYGNGDLKPIYFTEVGWSSVQSQSDLSGLRVDTESDQAYRMVAAYVAPLARSNVAGVAWYDLINDAKGGPTGTQSNFGLFTAPSSTVQAYQPKEAAWAFYLMRERLEGYHYVSSNQSDGILDYLFENGQGQTEHILMRSDLSQVDATSKALGDVTVPDVRGSDAVATDALGRPVAMSTVQGGVSIQAGDAPIYVTST